MFFVLKTGVSGGKLFGALATEVLTTHRQPSPPLIDNLPPDQPQPFIYEGLRPLAMFPPLHAKLLFVPGSGNRVVVSGDLSPENAQRAAGVEIRGYNQHAFAAGKRQALLRIL